MKANLLVCLLLLIPQIGTVRYSVPHSRTQSRRTSSGRPAAQAPFASQFKVFGNLFRSGRFAEAAQTAEEGYRQAKDANELEIAVRFLHNWGSSLFALEKYREALQVFLQARAIAENSGYTIGIGKLDFNISSLYLQLRQIDAAVESAGRAMAQLSGPERATLLPKLLIHMATLRARQGRLSESMDLFQQGIVAADRAGDLEMYTVGWSDLGEEYLKNKQLPEAEHALLEAYRVRKLYGLNGLENSYRFLGLLRLEQHNASAASALLDTAVELSSRPGGVVPTWEIYYARGRANLAQNRLRSALKDLRTAARLARTWRRSAPSDDATRISAENAIQSVHSALVEAGNRLYFAHGDASLAQETFEAAEANRAASLRALLAEPRTERRELPPAYWEILRRLESAQVDLLRGQDSTAVDRVQQLQGALIQLESRAGSTLDLELSGLLGRTRAALNSDTAFLGFHLASPVSYLWAVSRNDFALYRLPSASAIASEVDHFEEAVRTGSPQLAALGQALYRTLFGPMSPAFKRKKHWLLALDSHLFELPVSALVEEIGPRGPVFVVERHSLETTSGAGLLSAPSPSGSRLPGLFLGIADPIYNAADPRWPNSTQHSEHAHLSGFLDFFQARAASADHSKALHLARLAGSAREASACAAAWGGSQPPVMLEGASASRRALQAALQFRPSILHFATHILHPDRRFRSGVIALSLTANGQNEILSPTEIAKWHLDGAVVALSGCSSGSAEALPGTGLTGLTRAWQAAGARAVVASHWPTPDDAGALFLSFYRHLREEPEGAPATALQQAQIDMIRQQTWRSNPRYWGAYFVTGNQR